MFQSSKLPLVETDGLQLIWGKNREKLIISYFPTLVIRKIL
jgi:hypothetical protein